MENILRIFVLAVIAGAAGAALDATWPFYSGAVLDSAIFIVLGCCVAAGYMVFREEYDIIKRLAIGALMASMFVMLISWFSGSPEVASRSLAFILAAIFPLNGDKFRK